MEEMSDLQLLTGSITDLKWFKENSIKLVEEFEGQFIAIGDQKIVSFAPSIDILLGKLERKGVNENFVLIKKVTPNGEVIIL
ncbi:MAG: DUF5678 domain-containing protein [archaeon]